MASERVRPANQDALRKGFRLQALRAQRMHLKASLQHLGLRQEQMEQRLREVDEELRLLGVTVGEDPHVR